MPRALRWSLFILLSILSLSLLACQSKEEAQTKCKTLSAEVCKKMISCTPIFKQDECLKMLGKNIDCSKAAGWEADSYDGCIKEIKERDCEKIGDKFLPDSCKGVILVEE